MLDVGAGDEVITVSHSYIATANSVKYCGADPVFVDVELDTYNMDPAKIEAAITPKTKAILCVHQIGMPCDVDAIVAIGKKHNLPVIEDAACAIGSEIQIDGKWERIGAPRGDIAAFSFHPRKIVSTGDGGMLTTRNPAYDKQFKLLRQHAMSVPDTVRHGSNKVIFETHPVLGYNYRLTDIQAAVGREQLKRLPGIVADVASFMAGQGLNIVESGQFYDRGTGQFFLRMVVEPSGVFARTVIYCPGLNAGSGAPSAATR